MKRANVAGVISYVLVDPHAEDFIFCPVSFWFARRRALKKYEYISRSLLNNDVLQVYISGEVSSLPNGFFNRMPRTIKKIILWGEIKIWRILNRKWTHKINFVKSLRRKNVFLFGYKKSELFKHEAFLHAQKIICHLSHYHTFTVTNHSSSIAEKLIFAFDNDVGEHHYFKKKFPWYYKRIIIIPFEVKERFYEKALVAEKDKIEKCGVTGTYHDFDVSKVDFGILFENKSTLHPLRLEMATKDQINDLFDSKLALYKSGSGLVKKLIGAKQKKYFEFDIVSFYANHRGCVIPGEGTGAIAIGSLEAMASGCHVYLTEWEVKGLNLCSAGYSLYDGTYEGLLTCIKTTSHPCDSKKTRWAVEGFKANSLMLKARKLLQTV